MPVAAGWDHVHNLMAEVGGTLGAAESLRAAGQRAWHVSGGAGTALTFTYNPESDRFLFHSLLGRPEPSLREATYALLLTTGEPRRPAAARGPPRRQPDLRYAAPSGAFDADDLSESPRRPPARGSSPRRRRGGRPTSPWRPKVSSRTEREVFAAENRASANDVMGWEGGKSMLIEITRLKSEPEQLKLWEQVKVGRATTVRAARVA